jgi:ketosteroid isomerase-like protein
VITADEIHRCEETLREAILASDVPALSRLLGDQLIFTNQDGIRLTKEDDLVAHRSGQLSIQEMNSEGRTVRMFGDTAIVCVDVFLAGNYGGSAFSGTFAYTRVWQRQSGTWQVEAGHCSQIIRPA